MNKTVEKTVTFCDSCECEVGYSHKCACCGIEMCYDCAKKKMVKYTHSVWFQGSDDGEYCLKCDSVLTESQNDALHNAYVKIRNLRNEQKAWGDDFKNRAEAVGKEVETLRKEIIE